MLNTFLSHLTGVSVASLQRFAQPFLIALLAPVAFAAFRSLTGSTTVAALSSFLIFMQSEFLFEAVRGSHAKLTWCLALTMLFILSRSLRPVLGIRDLARWVPLFYLVAYGLISSSTFFASTFLFGIAFAALGGLVLAHWSGPLGEALSGLKRLFYTVLGCSVLVFLQYFYFYPPALRQFQTLKSIGDRVAVVLLDVEETVNPYGYISIAWSDARIYTLLTLLNWSLLILSLAAWLITAHSLLRKQSGISQGEVFLWLLYTAFALLMAISVLLDLAGVLSANLQVRVFPNFMIFAIPMAGGLILRAISHIHRWPRPARRVATAALILCALFFSIASLLKVTNDPLLNNFWLFQTTQERRSMGWVGTKLRSTQVWTGFDGRLSLVLPFYPSWPSNKLLAEDDIFPQGSRYFILSNPMEILSARLGIPLPDVQEDLKVYDNGGASVYHTRPKTPFQR